MLITAYREPRKYIKPRIRIMKFASGGSYMLWIENFDDHISKRVQKYCLTVCPGFYDTPGAVARALHNYTRGANES